MTIGEIRCGLPVGTAAAVPFTRPLPAVRLATGGAPTRPPVSDALTITLLGGFSVTRDNRRADAAAWERRVAQRLVRFLLLRRDRAVSEDEALETFWPDRRLDSARRSLHVAISRARRVLDAQDSQSVIDASDRVYHLRLRPADTVDADEFEMTALAALGEPGSSRLRSLELAAALWGGEPLPEERYTDWALGWRERLCDLHVAVLAAIADEYLRYGNLVAAGRRAAELVELDPLNEGAHCRLMVAYARAGRRSQALRQFLDCRRALVEQLGIEPSCEPPACNSASSPADVSDLPPSERVMQRLNAAMNAHDIESFLTCFRDDYRSEQPAHPARAFRGSEQVQRNWSAVFAGVPDFRSELLRYAADGDTVWSEWHWQGTQSDGSQLDMAGVMVCEVREGRIAWARLYMEPVEQAGAGIDSAVRRMTGDE